MDAAPRHLARERALSLLYEAELKGLSPETVLGDLPAEADRFTVELVRRADAVKDRADEIISEVSRGWPLERMAVLDRLVLRLAVAELLAPEGTPTAVVIDEAVELAKTYSTEESGRFVNGILSAVASRLGPPRSW